MSNATVDRNLLFGLLALQNGIITREALVSAFSVWLLDKNRMLDEILIEQRALSPERQVQLLQMLAWHIEMHGQDAAQSLAAVSSASSACQMLAGLGDQDIQASLQPLLKNGPAADLNATFISTDPNATVLGAIPSASENTLRFHSLRPHARGGLGEVSVAMDMELHREVALKEIQPQFADHPESRERFVLEAEITGGLEHPGIVPVYGLGTYSDGRPFYAMRFIKGDSLKEALQEFHKPQVKSKTPQGERQFQLRKLLGRFIDVCNAVEYAHSRGVLHRDLKPGNIMLGKYGETLVVDWGLAKSAGRKDFNSDDTTLRPASSLSSSGMTVSGKAIGTPAYMSPEQAAGRLDIIGPASDVYSLGATLYHVSTGHPPIEDKNVGKVLQRVQKGDFPLPRQVDSTIPRVLEAICLKAMALNPEDRYPSARALSDDLEQWLADEPVTAATDTFWDRLSRFTRKNQGYVRAGLAGLFVVALVSLIAAFWIDIERKKSQLLAKEQKRIKVATILALYFRGNSPVAVVSPNGELILTSDDYQEVKLWDSAEVKVKFKLPGHAGKVKTAAFSRDSKWVVTSAVDGTLKIWDTTNGKEIRTIIVFPNKPVPESAPDLASAAIAAPKPATVPTAVPYAAPEPVAPPMAILSSPPQPAAASPPVSIVECVAMSPDGTKIASGDSNHLVKIWDIASGNLVMTLMGHTETVTSVAFDASGKRLVSGGSDKLLKIWSAADGSELISKAGSSGVNWVTFSIHGDRVHRFDDDRSLTTFDAQTGDIVGNEDAGLDFADYSYATPSNSAPNMIGD